MRPRSARPAWRSPTALREVCRDTCGDCTPQNALRLWPLTVVHPLQRDLGTVRLSAEGQIPYDKPVWRSTLVPYSRSFHGSILAEGKGLFHVERLRPRAPGAGPDPWDSQPFGAGLGGPDFRDPEGGGYRSLNATFIVPELRPGDIIRESRSRNAPAGTKHWSRFWLFVRWEEAPSSQPRARLVGPLPYAELPERPEYVAKCLNDNAPLSPPSKEV